MPWRDADHGLAAARRGQDVVMAPHRATYLDYPQSADPGEPLGQAGEIVDLSGRVLGEHRGVVHFTVGQRRGIEIGGQSEPLYVVRIEPETKRLVVGPRRALAVEATRVSDLNWLGEDQRQVSVKVRSLAPPVPAVIDGDWVRFERPEYGVAPGQSAVFYDGSRMLGGGSIAETRAVALAEAA